MANLIPIQDLDTSEIPPNDRTLRAVITLVWPYSSRKGHYALLLSDPDFRLRSRKGQVKINFYEAVARAVAERRLGIGDGVQLDLTGAEWVDEQHTVATPGKSVGELGFRKGLRLRAQREGQEQVEVSVDGSANDENEQLQDAQPSATPVRRPNGVDPFRSSFGSAPGSFAIYSSPAFARRSRLSYLDGVSRLFEDEWEIEEQPRKKTRVSLGEVRSWKMVSRTPSPVKETFDMPVDGEARSTEDAEVSVNDDVQSAGAVLEKERSPIRTPVIAETPEAEVQDPQAMEIDGNVSYTMPEPTDTGGSLGLSLPDQAAFDPTSPNRPKPRASPDRTMLPPALPKLQMPSESPKEDNFGREESEGPLTPRLQPIHSGGLPLPSPFPAEPATQHSYPPAGRYDEIPGTYAEQALQATLQRRPQERGPRSREVQDTYADDDKMTARSPRRPDNTTEDDIVSSPMVTVDKSVAVVSFPDVVSVDAPQHIGQVSGPIDEGDDAGIRNEMSLNDEGSADGEAADVSVPPISPDVAGRDEEIPDSGGIVVNDEMVDGSSLVEGSDEYEDDLHDDGAEAMPEDDVDEAIDPDQLEGVEPSDVEYQEDDQKEIISQRSISAEDPGQSQAEPIELDDDDSVPEAPSTSSTFDKSAILEVDAGKEGPRASADEDSMLQFERFEAMEPQEPSLSALEPVVPDSTASSKPARPVTPVREPSPFVSGFDHLLQRESGFALPAFNMTPVAKSREAPTAMPQDRVMKHTFKNLFGFRGSQSPEKEAFVPAPPEIKTDVREALRSADDHDISIPDVPANEDLVASSPVPVKDEPEPETISQAAVGTEPEDKPIHDARERSASGPSHRPFSAVPPTTASGMPPSTAEVVDLVGSSLDVDENELDAREAEEEYDEVDTGDASGKQYASHDADLLPRDLASPENGDPLKVESQSANPFVLAGPEEERRKSENAVISEGPSDEPRSPTRASPLFSRDDADEAMEVAFGNDMLSIDAPAPMELHDSYPLPPVEDSDPVQATDAERGSQSLRDEGSPVYPELPQYDGSHDALELVDGSQSVSSHRDTVQSQPLHPPSVGEPTVQSGTSSFRELSTTPSIISEQALAQPAYDDYEMLDLSQPELQAPLRPSQSYRLSQASQRSTFSEVEMVGDSIDSPQSTIVAESSPHSGQPDDLEDFAMAEETDEVANTARDTEAQAASVLPSILPSQDLGQISRAVINGTISGEAPQVAEQYRVSPNADAADNADLPPRGTGYTEVIDLGSSSPAPADHASAGKRMPEAPVSVPDIDPSLAEQDQDDYLLDEFATDQTPPMPSGAGEVRSYEAELQPNQHEQGEHLPHDQASGQPPVDTSQKTTPQQRNEQTVVEQGAETTYPRLPMSPSFSQSQSFRADAQSENLLAVPHPLPITPMLTESASDLQTMIPNTQQSSHEADREDASATRNPQEALSKPVVAPKTPPKKSLRSRLSNVPDVISAWFSPKRSSNVTATIAERDAQASPVAEKFVASPMRHANGYRTDHSYFTSLCSLDKHLNPPSQQIYDSANTVDVLAVVTDHTKAPERAKGGPRDYFTVFHITDASVTDNSGIRVEVFRPWKAVLPAADIGDVVLLRAFAVKSRKRKTYLLSTDASAWCVWRFAEQRGIGEREEKEKPVWARRRADSDVREEVKGPPVEYGKAEKEQAVKLRAWWMATKGEEGNGLRASDGQSPLGAAKL